jgi:muramoyltetrapeptide carboxypeptidase LdcA involved in peptidoglycan recycling
MIIPDKLKRGDEIRIIAPARSMGILGDELKDIANKRLSDLGFIVTFGKHIDEIDDFKSSIIESRLLDLHDAFADKNVKGILTVIGGFNSNQLLDYIDWDLISNNPKVFCGFSDITILHNVMYAKTGLVSYSGPHYSSFGQKLYFDYTLDYFEKCCISNEPYSVTASSDWSDDTWHKDQNDRKLEINDGFLVINEGKASGTIIGGNLCTLNLLQGTQYMPSLDDSVLFIEDDAHADGTDVMEFDRNLQSLIQLPDFSGVKGIIIGRFQRDADMTNDLLIKIIKSKHELDSIPVIAGVDFGHTDPKITFPIGGTVALDTKSKDKIIILNH